MDTGKSKGPTMSPTNSLARSNLKRGVYSTMSNADYAKNITRKRILENLQTQSKVLDTYNAIAQSYNSHEKPRQNGRKMTSFRGAMGRHGQAGSWRGQ